MVIYTVENNELMTMKPTDAQAEADLLAERASSTATVGDRFAQGECALIGGRWVVPEVIVTTKGQRPAASLKVQAGKQGPHSWIQFLDGEEIVKRGVVAVAQPATIGKAN
jgi:hypothetical protein